MLRTVLSKLSKYQGNENNEIFSKQVPSSKIHLQEKQRETLINRGTVESHVKLNSCLPPP